MIQISKHTISKKYILWNISTPRPTKAAGRLERGAVFEGIQPNPNTCMPMSAISSPSHKKKERCTHYPYVVSKLYKTSNHFHSINQHCKGESPSYSGIPASVRATSSFLAPNQPIQLALLFAVSSLLSFRPLSAWSWTNCKGLGLFPAKVVAFL